MKQKNLIDRFLSIKMWGNRYPSTVGKFLKARMVGDVIALIILIIGLILIHFLFKF